MVDFLRCLGLRQKRSEQSEIGAENMLVSEGKTIFNNDNDDSGEGGLKIIIVSCEGDQWEVNVNPDFTVENLKLMALGHFYNPSETIKASLQYKLILISPERQLNEQFTLQQERVKQNDEILLFSKKTSLRLQTSGETQQRDGTSKGPDEATIKLKTAKVRVKNADRIAGDTVTVVDFQVELRKTLVSLIEAAQKIQLYNKNGLETFFNVPKSSVSDCEASGAPSVSKDFMDSSALKQLTDMGFSETKAREALQEKHMSAMDALEHLLEREHLEDVNDDDKRERRLSVISDGSKSSVDFKCEDSTSNTLQNKETASVSSSPKLVSLPQLLESFRAYKRREFKPNLKAFRSLEEMGFDREKIIDSLRVSGNNHDMAFEWLLSRWLTDDDLRRGLDTEGSVYKAIMSNPVVLIGLNSPKVLYAFLHMLENPNCANHWLNDPDTAPLLNQIFQIYHLEKYSLQIRPGLNS